MKKFLLILSIALGLFLIGCDKDSSTEPENSNTDIPADPVGVTPPATTINNVQPTATFSAPADNPSRVQMNLTGLLDPTTNNPINLFYDPSNPGSSNIFVTEDGKVKGLKVTKVGTGTILQADVVFTVDVSGSMGQESDSVAASIIRFANFLQASGLDVRFGAVGYYGDVRGAINFTNATTLANFLNRSSGTQRTVGFAGPDSAALETNAANFASNMSSVDENGVVGVLFADANFSWRASAQKVFVNFTDEPTQSTTSSPNWNTAQMCAAIAGRATVHTVFSEDTLYYNNSWSATNERPWDMSKCTGGTVKFIDANATGLDLTTLPVAGALSNSYLVEYVKSSSQAMEHVVVVIVKVTNADGSTTYRVTY